MPIDDQDEQEQPTPRLPTEKEQGPSNEQEFMPVQPSTVSESNPSPILADKAKIEIFDESKMHSQSKDVDPIEEMCQSIFVALSFDWTLHPLPYFGDDVVCCGFVG